MSCNKCLNEVLPWRKRRRAEEELPNPEEIALRQDEDLRSINISDGNSSPKFRYRAKFENVQQEDSSRGYHLLSLIMCSEEFERGDQMCVQLIKYIYQGNVEGLEDYLDRFMTKEIDEIEISGQSLLHILCFRTDIRCLHLVLSLGCDVNRLNVDGVTPLHIAVSEGWSEGVEMLLSYGASANIFPTSKLSSNWPFKELPILTAARNGDYTTVSILLEQNPNLLFRDSERNSILHLSCYSHCVELVSRLLEDKGICSEISTSNNKGHSPLHMLFIGENLLEAEEEIYECVKILLHKGARINHVDGVRKTSLYLAARSNLPSVVKYLLESGADPRIKTIDGKTVLHAACRSSSHESLQLLIKSGRVSNLLLEEDTYGYSPFHVAVSSCSINCCEILLQNGDHLTKIDSLGRSRCSLVLKNMPSAMTLLKRLFNSNIELSGKETDDPNFRIKMDFSVLLSKSNEDVEASLISDIGSSGVDSLLKHPLVETFLYLKWHKIRAFFYSYVFLYFLFLIIHTYYIVKTYGMKSTWENEKGVLNFVHVTHALMVVLLMVPGTITIFANFKKYFKQWETYFKVISLSTAAFVVFSREASFRNPDVQRNVAAVSIFFTWVEFMMLLGRFPSLGLYILMFTRVSKSITRFLFAFLPLLIAFTLCFGILLSKIEEFKSFPTAFVRTLMMMLGEMDYATIYEKTKTDTIATIVISHIYLVVFLFLIPVLMANLLIGLAVNDLPDLQYHGKIRRLVKEASYLESYERLLLVFKEWAYVPSSIVNLFSGQGSIKREIVIYPNKLNKNIMKGLDIPSDAIKCAIASGTIENSDENDIEISVNKFYKEYIADRERLQNAIETLTNMISSMTPQDTDVPDGKLKTNRKFRSQKIGRKI
ncbi:Transient receptor potential channel pyrexia [Armadillidium vulgare]|nr:Transient receptor potential channel pyrexia [Armadillidium vulgare]